MRLSRLGIIGVRGSKGIVSKLADALGVSEPSVYKYIRDNETNGELTKAAAIHVIKEETGLSEEEILESESEPESERNVA